MKEYRKIPANAKEDDHVFEMPPAEQCWPSWGHDTTYQISPDRICNRTVASAWPGSHDILTKLGCSKWRATRPGRGFLEQRRYVLHDRDTKFCSVFRATMTAGGIEPIQLPARSPNLNAYAERWVRSVKEECLSKLILFGEGSLRRAVTEFIEHFHAERNHQGKGNVLLFPVEKVFQQRPRSRVRCHERIGGLLRYYSYAA